MVERGRTHITCDRHGTKPWQGDVVCARDAGGCGAVYQTRDSLAPHFAPYQCVCGAALMHQRVDGSGVRTNFTARAICDTCFSDRVAGGVS